MLGCQVVQSTEYGFLIAEEAVSDPLLGHEPVGGLRHLAECGVDRKEGQQGDDEQPGHAGVAVVDLTLVFGQQLSDAELATGQCQDHDCRTKRADEAEGEQGQRQPRTDVAGDHRDSQCELGAEPPEQVDTHDHGQQPPPHAPGIDDQNSEVGPKHPSILSGARFVGSQSA